MRRHLGDDWTLPAIDDATRAWFTSGRLMVQRCDDCATWQHPPDEICSGCQGSRLSFVECGEDGRIESFVVVHRAVHPALEDRVPYAVALVSIDAAPGVHALGNVLGAEIEDLAIGLPVRAVFESVPDPDSGQVLQIPQWEILRSTG
jgi:uncharacterized OB-fold protein